MPWSIGASSTCSAHRRPGPSRPPTIIGDRLGLGVVIEPLLLEKGLDEDVVEVVARVQELLASDLPDHTVAVSHGDTIGLAVALLSRTSLTPPTNGSVTSVDPETRAVSITEASR